MSQHPIIHVDIPAQDPQAVSRFYSELFGWQLQPLPSMAYIRFQAGNGVTGGFVGWRTGTGSDGRASRLRGSDESTAT